MEKSASIMENQQWPVKYQQSGTGIDNIQDNLNNGVKDNDGTQEQNGDGVKESDKQEEGDSLAISEKARQLIALILDHTKELSNAEKYLLHLKLFQISNVVDPLRQPLNPLGSRSEINRTISWIKTHLEEDSETSLPKQEVYEEYTVYCSQNQIKSLSQADFGKVMKQVYPKVRARRLGTRGNSRYCYSGLRRCIKLKPPKLPDLGDKSLSTEAPCSQSALTAAAWLIVKEWTEFHFKLQFPSLQALARFLVISHSVGVGTDAASQLTSASESQLKGELCSKGGTKHREMQLQLQKKIQQKNDKERKRKIQSPKSEPKTNGKKSKSTPTLNRSSEESSPTLSSTSTSTSTSPTQGKPICDKSVDFTQLPSLPDFKSFQKPATNEQQQNGGTGGKIPIPRLALKAAQLQQQQQQQRSPHASPKKQQAKNAKYKAIQPKPQTCDNASYNNSPHIAADSRTQAVSHIDIDRFKEKKEECDAQVFPLSRERLNSISSVDKDAMDEYLGTNNSQHEEELSKYFNNIEHVDHESTSKISQLRQLLEQNGISENKNFLVENNPVLITNPVPTPPLPAPSVNIYSLPANQTVATSQNSSARRRVSFETPFHEDAVPPSPNTRRKNFSFTPISPGPQSPNGRQSKCSSTNVSPFVSPRNTPISRTNAVRKKIKREADLSVDIPDTNFVMSAPVSPMPNKSVLEKLLHSNSKVPYTPDYVAIKTDVGIAMDEFQYRSQSVPVGQMSKSIEDGHFLSNLSNPNADFNDFDPIAVNETTVNNIIDALEEPANDIYDVAMQPSNFNIIPANFDNAYARVARSHSIDVTCPVNPSTRSVPSTPLPFNKPPPVKSANHSSRSYPSTPQLMSDTAFNYALNSDCLLNGQPIRSREQPRDLTFFMNLPEGGSEENNDEFGRLQGNEFGIVENEAALIDESVLIGEPNYTN